MSGSVDDQAQYIQMSTPDGDVEGILARAPDSTAGVIMVGGAGGGMHGPGGVYPDLAGLLRREGITALRLDYRLPTTWAPVSTTRSPASLRWANLACGGSR